MLSSFVFVLKLSFTYRELLAGLDLTMNQYYHVGLYRDKSDFSTWRLAASGERVELSPEQWGLGYPETGLVGWNYVQVFYQTGTPYHAQLTNFPDLVDCYFICEYL